VGIDDVATRKGQKYATAVYDMKDHHLVARDRVSAYVNAINEILPDCIQVADRFHLLQNLIEQMKQVQGITEQLKAEKPVEWVQRVNNIRACAMEIVNTEIIYA